MKYTAMITVKKDGAENNIHMEFDRDDVYDVLQAFDAILNYSAGDEVSVFARRWTE